MLLLLPRACTPWQQQNEYTDWERPPRNQLGSRDAALELLSDGHTVAPLIRLGYLHSLRGGKSYFMHYKHRTGERDFPQVRYMHSITVRRVLVVR
jgi:Carboxylesterase family